MISRDDGGCKQVVALLFAVADFVALCHKEQSSCPVLMWHALGTSLVISANAIRDSSPLVTGKYGTVFCHCISLLY